MHPNHNLTTLLVQRAVFFVIRNGQNSHEITWAETTPHGLNLHWKSTRIRERIPPVSHQHPCELPRLGYPSLKCNTILSIILKILPGRWLQLHIDPLVSKSHYLNKLIMDMAVEPC